MKTFYGGTFISKNKLEEAKIYNPIKLEYYKIKEDDELKEKYGIEIIKTEYQNSTIKTENIVLEEITEDENVANKVLDLMKRNEVTPISARDVLEDIFYNITNH